MNDIDCSVRFTIKMVKRSRKKKKKNARNTRNRLHIAKQATYIQGHHVMNCNKVYSDQLQLVSIPFWWIEHCDRIQWELRKMTTATATAVLRTMEMTMQYSAISHNELSRFFVWFVRTIINCNKSVCVFSLCWLVGWFSRAPWNEKWLEKKTGTKSQYDIVIQLKCYIARCWSMR